MSTIKTEFNTIKTIKLINKDSILKTVFAKKCESYNYNKLMTSAEANELADETIEALQDIYNEIVTKSGSHSEIYNSIEVKEKTPRRYGKKQIQADIEAQDGVATENQQTMLHLAELKAMTATLHDRGVSDQYKGTKKFNRAKHRKLRASIRDFRKSVKDILKS